MHLRQDLWVTFQEYEGNSQLRIIMGSFATVMFRFLLRKVEACPLHVSNLSRR